MKKFSTLLVLASALSLNLNAQIKYPSTESKPVTEKIHSYTLTDPYRWLEEKPAPETKAWSHAQHEFTIDFINSNYPEIAGLKDELLKVYDRDYVSAPIFRGKREFFYARHKGDKQNKLYTRIKGKEILIFDPEKYDKSGKASISGFELTKDASRAAVGIQYAGNEIDEFRIIDTKNGKVFGDPITGLTSMAFTKDEKHAYIYVRTQEMIDKQIPVQVYLHKLGDKRENDIFIAAPKDAKDNSSVWDDSNSFTTFKSEGDFFSNNLYMKKIGSNEEFKQIFVSREFEAQPTATRDGKFYFFTNDHAPNFKVMVADTANAEYSNWATFYPEKENSVLTGFRFTKNKLFITYKQDVLNHLAVYDTTGNFIQDIELPFLADVSNISYRKSTDELLVTLSSFQSLSKVYTLNPDTYEWKLIFESEAPIPTDNIESELVFFPSKDLTKVPLFLIHKKGIKLDGNNPTLLYGYGGFNVPMTPGYLGQTLSFINRGGVYAIACLRGGNEYGEKWHRDGMLFNKQHTFDDCISAAEYLVKNNYTNPEKLAVKGGSNGGLLVGAVITQRPDLFKTALCAVPLLDMVRYHKFLIARYWIPEYGDPDVKEDFEYILTYSPYQNIKLGYNYPATLVTCGENDIRVDALHAKKFVAALQNNPGQVSPALLFVDFESGHGSGKSIEKTVNNAYLEWRFLMGELKMK